MRKVCSEVSGTAYDAQPLAKEKKEIEKPKDEYILMPANPHIRGGQTNDVQPTCQLCGIQEPPCGAKDIDKPCGGKDVDLPCAPDDICLENICPSDDGCDIYREPCDKDKPAPEPCSKSRCDILA